MAQNVFRTVQRLLDATGAIEPGAIIEFYTAGTTTPLTVYSDRALTTTAGTSVTADASGSVAERWVADSVNIKLVYKDADGNTVYTRDYANDDQIFDVDAEHTWGARQNFYEGAYISTGFYFTTTGADDDPVVNFASNDYLLYDVSANELSLVIGSTTYFRWAAAGATLGTHLLAGADSSYDLGATATRFRVGYLDDIELRPSSSRTPAANGDVSIELTNNTTLTFKAKGSDGTVRSGTVTLS